MSKNELTRRFPTTPDKTMVHCEGAPIKIENMPYYLTKSQQKAPLNVGNKINKIDKIDKINKINKIKIMGEETNSHDVSIRKRMSQYLCE